jgi:hypothetical protein
VKAAGKLLGFGKEKDGKLDERTEQQKKADLDKGVGEANKFMEEKDATTDSVRTKLPAIQSKYKLTSLQLVKDAEDEYHVEAKINPEEKGPKHKLGQKGGSFKLAPGGFTAHEGDILSSEDEDKKVHLLTKHGPKVVSLYLKDRLQEPLKEFRKEREEREKLYRKEIASIRKTIDELWKQTENVKPDKLEKILKRIHGEQGLESQLQNIQSKLRWMLNIKEDDKPAIEHALNTEWRLNITFRATKFYNKKIMEKAVMEALEQNQDKIDRGFTDEKGNSLKVGTTLRPPIKHKFSQNLGKGYELSSNMEVVPMGSLNHVVVILVLTDSEKRFYKMETAYPEP